jgi:hypothetical protein
VLIHPLPNRPPPRQQEKVKVAVESRANGLGGSRPTEPKRADTITCRKSDATA